MWTIRLSIIFLLYALIGLFAFLLKNRARYGRILENRILNILTVILYNLCCYLPAVLPPAYGSLSELGLVAYSGINVGFRVFGCVLIGLGALLGIATLRRRRAVGGQDTPEGLITSGPYRFCRHPIYAGIVLVSLGLPLLALNPDGLLVFPLVLLANTIEAKIEETHDIGVRFKLQYEGYKKTTRMLGPVWFWAGLVLTLLILTGFSLPCGP
jgi:protein-S-isoprenylcysteine O-methyltransferase Ste14